MTALPSEHRCGCKTLTAADAIQDQVFGKKNSTHATFAEYGQNLVAPVDNAVFECNRWLACEMFRHLHTNNSQSSINIALIGRCFTISSIGRRRFTISGIWRRFTISGNISLSGLDGIFWFFSASHESALCLPPISTYPKTLTIFAKLRQGSLISAFCFSRLTTFCWRTETVKKAGTESAGNEWGLKIQCRMVKFIGHRRCSLCVSAQSFACLGWT